MKKLLTTVVLIGLTFSFSGCGHNRAYNTWSSDPFVHDTINKTINSMADQLLQSSKIKAGDKVAIASFVDLNKLNKTTHYGRNIAESFYNELYVRGFDVVDARGTKTYRINANGEFFISRDIKLLKGKRFANSYVLVGTYSKFGKGVLLNARIIDNKTGQLVASARSIYHNNSCDFFENCTDDGKILPRTISISDAGCSYVTCPTNCYDGECGEDVSLQIAPVKIKKTKQTSCGCK